MSTATHQSQTADKVARESRLSIRTSAEQKELLRRAAKARNTDVSKFVLETSLGEAKRLIAEESIIVLSPLCFRPKVIWNCAARWMKCPRTIQSLPLCSIRNGSGMSS